MDPSDYVEPWMVLSDDEDSAGNFLRGLLSGMFWFPVHYHPELGDPFEPGSDDEIAVLLGKDSEGEFIPIYTLPELMRMDEERFAHPYSRARMKGGDLLVALRNTAYPVVINAGTKIPLMLPPSGVRKAGLGLIEGEKLNRARERRKRRSKKSKPG